MADNSPAPVSERDALDVGSYQYRMTWLLLLFPMFGLLGIYLAWGQHSVLALGVSIAVEVLCLWIFLEYKTYQILLGGGFLWVRSCFHRRRIVLADIDLMQHLTDGGYEPLLYLRRRGKLLLKVSGDLDGFDDLLGLLRAYAHRHHIEFRVRDE